MKVVVIGGGIAGMGMAIMLEKMGMEYAICERSGFNPKIGHAFLLHADGYSLIEIMDRNVGESLKANRITEFHIQNYSTAELNHEILDSWYAIKRSDLLEHMRKSFDNSNLQSDREFSHFLYKGGEAIAAVFTNGKIEYGDVFIGADGSNSAVRKQIMPEIDMKYSEIKEVVSLSKFSLPAIYDNRCTKFHDEENQLAFGMIPVNVSEAVWYIQYNYESTGFHSRDPYIMKDFCLYKTRNFPSVVAELIEATDFENAYLWDTKDFDALPSFSKGNVGLIGDAAHLCLPFTSAGTTNALVDALTLSSCLEGFDSPIEAFSEFYNLRIPTISKHIDIGRRLKNNFLVPAQKDHSLVVPLFVDRRAS